MGKIIRTATRAEGGITPEEKYKLDEVSKKWIANAFKVGRTDKEALKDAIVRLYKSAGLKEPRVVVVPSPMVMACAYGLASGVLYLRKSGGVQSPSLATLRATDLATDLATREATREATLQATEQATWQATSLATREATEQATSQATDQATYQATEQATDLATREATEQATWQATEQATYQATYQATREATEQATYQATYQATREATEQATWQATEQATYQATYQATREATEQATYQATSLATRDRLLSLAKAFGGEKHELLLSCVSRWYSAYQEGNMWSGFLSYAEGMRDVIGLKGLECFEKYQAYEDAGRLGGFRVMHEDFCIVSDFPDVIKINKENRPHCENGPSHRWSDGFEIYSLNGIRVPKWLVMTDAGKIDPTLALTEKNVDVQREIIRKVGAERMLKATGAKTLDVFVDDHSNGGNEYKLMEMSVGDIRRKYLYFEHASIPGVFYAHPVHPNIKKALHARAWMLGLEIEEMSKMKDAEVEAYLPEFVS